MIDRDFPYISLFVSLSAPLVVISCLRWLGLPPIVLARKFTIGRDAVGSLAAIAAAILSPRGMEWVFGLSIAAAAFLTSIGVLVKLARDVFYKLLEAIPLKPAMSQEEVVPNLLISHVSDIHITSKYFDRFQQATVYYDRFQGGAGGQHNLEQWLTSIQKLDPPILVVSGDVTDTGESIEWLQFLDKVNRYTKRYAIVLAPGNHDLSKEYGSRKGNKPELYFLGQSLLEPSMLTCTGEQLSRLIERADEEVSLLVPERAERLKALQHMRHIPSPNYTAEKELISEWFDDAGKFFPLRLDHKPSASILFVLNSVIVSPPTLGDSALGQFSEEQVERLLRQLKDLPSWALNIVIVTHHAPVRRPGEYRAFFGRARQKLFARLKNIVARLKDYAFLGHQADEARNFMLALSELADKYHDKNFFVLCGHRHTGASGRVSRVLVLEAPSLAEGAATWLVSAQGGRVQVYHWTFPSQQPTKPQSTATWP